jgi:hypothetical protein
MQAGFTVLPAGGLKLAVSIRADLVLLNEFGKFGNGGRGG